MKKALLKSLSENFLDTPFNANTILSSHCEFVAWLLDYKAEHNLHHYPLFFLLTKCLKIKSLMLHEISHVFITILKNHLHITYNLNQTSFHLNITITSDGLLFEQKETRVKFTWRKFNELMISNIYHITSGYQAKKIFRIFINESALIPDIIYHESHKAQKGKKDFSDNYNLIKWFKHIYPNLDSYEDYALKIMEQGGELIPYNKLVQIQSNNPKSIYGTIFNKHSFDIFGYKLNMAKCKQPEILSIGSSRAHPFKEHFFTQPFYNASYTMTYLQEGKRFLEQLFKTVKPSVILFCVEYWWFHPNHYSETAFLPLHNDHTHFDSDYINKLYEYYADGILTPTDIEKIFKPSQQDTSFKPMGLRAHKSLEGYFFDGYYWYAHDLANKNIMKKKDDTTCLNMIDENYFHFEKATHLNQDKFRLFKEIIALCHQHGVKPILILPPFTKKIYSRLINGVDYKYIHEVTETLSEFENCELYNFLDPDTIRSPDSEFYDCYHGGDITYARILHTILQKQDTILKQYCSNNHLNDIIQLNTNKVIEDSLSNQFQGAR